MPLEIVKGMVDTPNACACCGSNPVDERTGQPLEAIWASGVDIDWGNSLYICLECAHIIANLIDRSTQEGFDKVSLDRDYWKSKYEELKEQHDELQEVVDQIRTGAAASKKLRERVATR